jgi:flagellin-specific chaperone FliS
LIGILLEANLRKDPKGVGEVIQRITDLRDAWATMLAQQGQTTDTAALTAELSVT